MRAADLTAVHSQVEKDYLCTHAKIPKDKIQVFPPLPFEASDLKSDSPDLSTAEIKKKYGIKQKSVVLYMGQHGRHKNIPGIFFAMEKIWANRNDAAVVIAGGSTKFTPDLKNLAEQYNRGELKRIFFIDDFPQESKAEIFKMADVFISLSEFESFGIVFAEAMKYGLPVIASLYNAASSMIEDFRTGLLVNPLVPQEVGSALTELLSDAAARKYYGDTGRKKVLEEYHPEKILDRWEKVISNLTVG
jgi:glycosyltransferase involved in cell wall biosynthesis